MRARTVFETKNTIKGGKGDKLTPKDVCPKQLAIGRKVEREHASSKEKETEIALDHLAENPKYYSELVEKGFVDEKAAIKEYIKHFGEKKLSKKVLKSLNEAMDFERSQDPKRIMGLGKKVQIEKELEEEGIDPSSVEITDDLILKAKGSYESEKIQKIAIKYLRPEWKKFVEELREGDPKKAVENALENGIEYRIIEDLIKEFGKFSEGYNKVDHKTPAWIHFKKLTRDEEKKQEDDEYNDYVFLAFRDKIPVTVNGKKYYEDGWGTEGMIKIDKYDTSSLSNVSGLKLRARYAGGGSNVYMISVPADFMDEERYSEFPDTIQQNFDEYLERGIIKRI